MVVKNYEGHGEVWIEGKRMSGVIFNGSPATSVIGYEFSSVGSVQLSVRLLSIRNK